MSPSINPQEDFPVFPVMAYRNTCPVKSLYPEGGGLLYNFLVIHNKFLQEGELWSSIGIVIEDAATKTVLALDRFSAKDDKTEEIKLYKSIPKYTFEVKEIDILEFDRREYMISEVEHMIKIWRTPPQT